MSIFFLMSFCPWYTVESIRPDIAHNPPTIAQTFVTKCKNGVPFSTTSTCISHSYGLVHIHLSRLLNSSLKPATKKLNCARQNNNRTNGKPNYFAMCTPEEQKHTVPIDNTEHVVRIGWGWRPLSSHGRKMLALGRKHSALTLIADMS